jgi:hypothetical protein
MARLIGALRRHPRDESAIRTCCVRPDNVNFKPDSLQEEGFFSRSAMPARVR